MKENIEQSAQSTRYEGLKVDSNTLSTLLDTNAMLNAIKISLLGLEYDAESNEWVKTREALMDINGVHDYMRLLDSCIGTPQQLSGITEKEKKELLRKILFNTIDFIYFNKIKYNIKESHFGTIYTIIRVNMNLFLNKSQNQIVIELIKAIHGTRETIHKTGESRETDENKNAGGFNFFGGRKQ